MSTPTGGISPPPLVSSLTGSGLRSLFLAIAISREGVLGRHSRGDSSKGQRDERSRFSYLEIEHSWGDVSTAPS
jgi:hypothetical protein